MSGSRSTVLSLWLPVRDSDEAAIESGAVPDIYRIRVPHAPAAGTELTQLQKVVIKMADANVREVHLVINKSFDYPKHQNYLNTLSRAVSSMYNEWADADADVDASAGDEEEEDESDDSSEEDEEEEDDDDESEEEPPPKKTKVVLPYSMPTATVLTAGTVLAPHLNLTRPGGEPARIEPYSPAAGEHYVVVHVTQDDSV